MTGKSKDSVELSITISGKPRVVVSCVSDGDATIFVDGARGSGIGLSVTFDNLAALDTIADAIYHLKMDLDSEKIMASQSATVDE